MLAVLHCAKSTLLRGGVGLYLFSAMPLFKYGDSRMLTENERMMRQKFMPIAVLEHHQMIDPVLSDYDICDRLGALWLEIRRVARQSG